jgi:lipoprotein-anchoring transpeptidase ErfK/SrfK
VLPGEALPPPGTYVPPKPVPLAPPVPPPGPRSVETLLEAQIALARQGISSGSIDGANGYQTRAALRAFQARERLPQTGALDVATRSRLRLEFPAFTNYVVATQDLARLRPVPSTWLGKSQQPRLDYASLIELAAERHRAHPALVRKLNPDVGWTNLAAGQVLTVPFVPAPVLPARLAFLRIGLQDRMLSGYDLRTNLLLHFPCSIASRIEKRPLGRLEVVVIARDPAYTFNPAVFPESAEGRRLGRKLTIPPGPNNPVGVAWIGLSRRGYGIHGTPRPEDVGRTESHGCFRLANWDAEVLVQHVWRGLPVYVQH